MHKTVLFAMAAFAASGLATPAAAEARPVDAASSTKTINVNFADLNLRSQDGRTMLDRRLASAVRKVCGVNQSRSLTQMIAIQDCRQVAHADVTTRRDALFASLDSGKTPTMALLVARRTN